MKTSYLNKSSIPLGINAVTYVSTFLVKILISELP